MGTFLPADLMLDTAKVVFGATEFSWGVWLLGSLLLLGCALLAATLTRSTVLNIAAELTARRGRVLVWVPLSVICLSAAFALFVVTVVGAPIGLLIALTVPVFLIYGYAAITLAIGHWIAGLIGSPMHDLAAIGFGVIILRTIRVIPFLGGAVHGLVTWIGFAAATMVAWDMSVSWYRRRMPDDQQFPGKQPIEWDDVTGQSSPEDDPNG